MNNKNYCANEYFSSKTENASNCDCFLLVLALRSEYTRAGWQYLCSYAKVFKRFQAAIMLCEYFVSQFIFFCFVYIVSSVLVHGMDKLRILFTSAKTSINEEKKTVRYCYCIYDFLRRLIEKYNLQLRMSFSHSTSNRLVFSVVSFESPSAVGALEQSQSYASTRAHIHTKMNRITVIVIYSS